MNRENTEQRIWEIMKLFERQIRIPKSAPNALLAQEKVRSHNAWPVHHLQLTLDIYWTALYKLTCCMNVTIHFWTKVLETGCFFPFNFNQIYDLIK